MEFLEGHVGVGSVFHCRLCTERESDKFNGSAMVQFKTQEVASRAVALARSGRLFFRDTKIAVWPANKGNQKGTRRHDSTTRVDDATLHMGCLIQKGILHKLWTCPDSRIEVDNTNRRFGIIVRVSGRKVYKLEWRFRDIHEISRCKVSGGRSGQHFMLRVWYAPQVFEQVQCAADYYCGDHFGFSFDDIMDPVWVRTTDFTPQSSIGQSFVYCIETPQKHGKELDYLIHGILEFSLEEKNLSIRPGFPYCSSQVTVPILHSPDINKLPFELVFLVNSLVQQGFLSGPSLGRNFFSLLEPSRKMPSKYIVHVLDKMRREEDTCFEPEEWFRSGVQQFQRQVDKDKLTNCTLDDGLMRVRKLYVTPSRVYCMGPEVDVSNRVTRHFIDHIDDFIRVSFTEEDFDIIPSSALVVPRKRGVQANGQSEPSGVYEHIISVLNDGITIGEKEFQFLAFSTSQLRENSVWMFSSNARVSAHEIRNWMGNFLDIRNVAKCAARMGQSFSSSTKSLDVPKSEVEPILDIWNEARTYRFSDGIGMISASFATKVAKKCRLKKYGRIPSLYQIRYSGYKGVVAVNPTSSYKISLRPSMYKFQSTQIGIDILNWSHPIPSYLNREIITLLSTLGVHDYVFEKMQRLVMQQLDEMLKDREVALDVLQTFCGGNSHHVMVDMLLAGFDPALEPFLTRMLHAFRAVQLMRLRRKTRIFVPQGRLLMGCLDETATLNYGQVFISVSPTPGTPHKIFNDGLLRASVCGINGVAQDVCIVKGKVIVAKNPCVHPGDVRVLTAVDVPSLHHLVDCIAFPQKGPRSHPSECSGSDLDGDLYFVSWDENLIPPMVDPPQDYQGPEEQELDRPVTTQDIVKYFVEFMVNNSLGLISNAHVVFADLSRKMARDPKCLQLARLCSIAVDFPKTGVPAVLPADLRPTKYPDFMEKTDKPVYESGRILGKLFRAVVEESKEERITSFTKREAAKCYDKELELEGFEHYLEEALAYKTCYDERLVNLMNQYDVKTEAEIFTGNILSLSKWFQKRPGEVKERIMRAMNSLRKEARTWLKDHEANLDDDDDYNDSDSEMEFEELAKASAWYHVTYHPNYVSEEYAGEGQGHLLSFPWVVYDKILEIKKMWRGG